jgi:uncharacterized protein YxjI/ribosomal protein L40E
MESERLYCMHCGARIVPGATFCRICGYPVRRASEPANRREPEEERIQPESTPVEQVAPPEPEEERIQPESTPVEQVAPPEPTEERTGSSPQEEPVEEPVEETSAAPPQVEKPTTAAAEAQPEEVPASAFLFDENRLYYVFDRSWWGFGEGSFYDEKGNIIGHMYRRILTVRRSIEFRETDNTTVSAVLHRKLAALDTMEIEDGRQLHLAMVKMKTQKPENLAFWLEDLKGNLILYAEGDFEGFSFFLYDASKNVVAEIDKAEKWKDIFVSGDGFSFKDKHAIVIQQGVRCERRFILPLVIAVEEALHEEHKTK